MPKKQFEPGRESERNGIRVRAAGLLLSGDSILMTKLRSPVRAEPIWLPPGGAVKKGETLENAVEREILEETGIYVVAKPENLCLIHEFIEYPLHAIEFYFRIYNKSGKAGLGKDPERKADNQILLDTRFIPISHFNRNDIYPEYLREHIHELTSPESKLRHIRSVK